MNKQDVTFNTIEDMVRFVVENSPRISADRWQLDVTTNWEYIDKEAGEKWDEENSKIPYVYHRDPGRKAYEKIQKQLEKRRPEQHHVTHYTLRTSYSHFRVWSIELSNELGKLIDSTWKKGTRGRYSSFVQRVGSVTMAGILKRLGNTDVDKQIKKAQAAIEAETQKNSRNISRRTVKHHAEEIIKLMDKHPEIWGGKVPTAITQLSKLIEE